MDPVVFVIVFLPALFGWMYLQKFLDKSFPRINPTYRFAVELLVFILIAFYSPMISLLVFTLEGFVGLIILRMKDMFE